MPESMVGGNRVTLLHDGGACLPAMLEAIAGAQREILLEMYWFASDDTGEAFARALEERARAGVRVCVTYDAFGSFEASPAMFERLRAAGCGVLQYNPARFFSRRFSFARFNRRNHRKQLIIDGRLGFTGGVNLGDPWAPVSAGGQGFRDDMIAIEGPAVRAMRAIFLRTYRGTFRVEALREALGSAERVGHCLVRVLTNDRTKDRRLIERAYLDRIRSARHRILITNSYFIPGMLVRNALAAASARGVEVRVLVPLESDVAGARYASRRLYTFLLKRGIQLHEWGPSILHSKTAVIDGVWCTVGTHNLDHRSWAHNLEINVVVEQASVAGELEARMQHDMDASARVDLETFRFRPLVDRLLEQFFYLFRRVL